MPQNCMTSFMDDPSNLIFFVYGLYKYMQGFTDSMLLNFCGLHHMKPLPCYSRYEHEALYQSCSHYKRTDNKCVTVCLSKNVNPDCFV